MINLWITIRDNKIDTSFQEKELNLSEACMLVYELERIKQDLINRDWNVEFKIEEDGE